MIPCVVVATRREGALGDQPESFEESPAANLKSSTPTRYITSSPLLTTPEPVKVQVSDY